MMDRIAFALAAILLQWTSALAQAPAAPDSSLKFEVASLKPSAPGGRGGGIRPAPGGERYLATNVSLNGLITVAYRIKAEQVAGGPDWINTDVYNMNGQAERTSNVEELPAVLHEFFI